MGDRGGMKKHVEFEDDDQHNNNKGGGSVSSSSFSSRTSSGGCSDDDDDDDDLITLEDEFLTKSTPTQSSKQPEHEQYNSDLTPPPSCQPYDHKLTGESYDSSRIPSAVFSSRLSSTAAADWSVASNESLFSLHMGGGNQSFSKDQAFLMNKSGELPRILDDCTQQYSSGLASVTEVEEPSSNLLVKDDNSGGNKNAGSKPVSNDDDDALGNKSEDCHNSSPSPHSDHCSMHSNQSFAFPVFSDDLGRNKTVRLEQQNQQKSAKKRQQQVEKEDEELQQNESKPKKASSFSKRSWIPRCSCFSLPCK